METRNALFEAITAGDGAAVDGLLAADPTLASAREGEAVSPLLHACYHRQAACVDRLLAAGSVLTLHEAAATGRLPRVVEILDEEPGRVDEFAPDGFHPLALAAFFGQAAVVEELLARGAVVDRRAGNAVGVAALHAAIASGNLGIVRALVAAGADVNARQQAGYTPLHGAASGDLGGAVDLLLAHGADPSARSDDGKTPADIARERGHVELAERLSERPGTRTRRSQPG